MFVGIREIIHAKGRFGLITVVVGLITLLLVMLTGLTDGLGRQNTSALEALDPPSIVFSDMEEPSFTTSRFDTASAGTTPLGASQTLLEHATGAQESVAVLGLPRGTELPGGTILGTTAIASESLGVRVGDQIELGGIPTTVGATIADLQYSHTPVVWVPTETWQKAAHTDAVGTVLFADEGGLDLRESFQALPAYQSEQSSLTTMQVFLYIISALVTVAFLTIWTMQRTRDLAILKAIGASNSYLLKDALGQAAIILFGGVFAGTVLAFGLGMLAAQAVPFSLTWLSVLGPAAGIWLLGMAGAGLATRNISRIDPNQALAGAIA